ncbi:MAG: SH3 domain-containing protein [Phycisphaerae bacterium]
MEFHINFLKSVVQLTSDQSSKMVLGPRLAGTLFILVILASIASISFAQPAIILPEESASTDDANAVSAPSFPYVAEITGDDVNIRSGPGTNYYSCGKLNTGDRVEVVSEQFGWSRIVPPAGNFSWISMQYVSINLDDPTLGTVTGDIARVYVGADDVEPMHSLSEQIRLKRGDKVKLLGEEKDDYYKIAPPSGAYLWVSTQYTKPAAPVAEMPPPIVEPIADANMAVPTEISVEDEKLKEYYVLQKQIKAERAKPIDQQNYADIKKQLTEITNNKEAGKAARYAEYVIGQIEGFELALAVAKEVQLQNEQLQQIMQRIDKARTTRLAKAEDLGRFVVVGVFETFKTYGPGHYRIVDDSGKMICYVLPSEQVAKMDLSEFVGRKVGLVGAIQPHPQTAGALVRFKEIVELN